MNYHSEERWYWSMGAKDGLERAVEVYQARFEQKPSVVWLNPATVQQLQPVGIDVQADGYLPRSMAAFDLPTDAVSVPVSESGQLVLL